MTPQEAIKAMKFYKEKLYNGIFNQYISAFDVAISALEKQIPKKPLQACGHATDKTMNYCPVCGQALDWSDIE